MTEKSTVPALLARITRMTEDHDEAMKGWQADRHRIAELEAQVAQARAEGAAKALEKAANRVAAATHPHNPTFGAYMHAAQIVRTTAHKATP